LIPALKKIKQITCGENHVLARDHKGAVFSWGSGQQNQLGRRIIERTRKNGLKPREFGLPKGITHVGAGAYHSFAIGKDGKVYSWGLNNFGETGIEEDTKQQANNENAETVIWKPKVIKSLIGKEVTCIHGGAHHSIAVTKTGDCLVWGRIDGYQMGMKIDALPEEHVIRDDKGKARILTTPTKVPGIDAAYATAGSDHCIAITTNGKAYSWGFSANYQTGQGSDDDVEVAKMIDNTAVRDQELNWAGAGGQFSIVTSIASK
jgi:regulator of chromosome condensation